MLKISLGARTAVIAAVMAFSGASIASAEPFEGAKNEFRAAVVKKRAAMIERVIGSEAAKEFLARPEIIGGSLAGATTYRAQVGLLQANISGNFNAQFCGGTLIAAQWVLTAAHCVDDLTSHTQLHVVTGTSDLNAGGVRRSVSKIIIHPQWNATTFDYDFALVKLSTLATGIPVAALMTAAQEPTHAPVGEPARTVGWGDTVFGGGTGYPSKLMHVTVPVISRTVCASSKSYGASIKTSMMCAGYMTGGKDSCQGDSGGPLYVQNEAGTYRLLAGVVSWGSDCAVVNFPGVYARVSVVRSWILSKMAQG